MSHSSLAATVAAFCNSMRGERCLHRGLQPFKKNSLISTTRFQFNDWEEGLSLQAGSWEVKPRGFLALSKCFEIIRSESSVPCASWGGRGLRVLGSSSFCRAGAPGCCCELSNPPWQCHAGTSSLPMSAHSSSALPGVAGF